ncbi:MAG: DNA polymerase III subunit alpha [Thermodesulfobacteriota bacterium]
MNNNGFVHLHLHSEYSLLDSTIKFRELFSQAKEYNMEAVALTDHGNLFGAIGFYEGAKKAGIKPIIGCEVYINSKVKSHKPSGEKNHHLVLLSMNQKGYNNLSNLVTKSYFEDSYGKPRINHMLLDTHREGLLVLSGCLDSELSGCLLNDNFKEALQIAEKYKEIFGDRYYLEVQANKLAEQELVNKKIKEIGKKLGIPLVATNDCHYLKRENAKPHDVLFCIQTGATLKDEKRFRFKGDEYFFKSHEEMLQCLDGFEDAIERTVDVAKRCDVEFERNVYKLPEFELEEEISLDEYMAQLAIKKLEERIKENRIPEEKANIYKERLASEIETIKKIGFSEYFLAVSDFINYAKSNGIPVGPGRGSSAGSLVAYALGITEIDPISHNLLLQRFLNPERGSIPDIDVDFCAKRRDEIIRYVTEKYGVDKVARIGTFREMSSSVLIKEVGRVLEIPHEDIDKIVKLIPKFRGKEFSIDKSIDQVPQLRELIEKSPILNELIEIARPLENMVRYSSTHSAAIVISNEPLADYIPLYKGLKDEVVTQFDKYSIENLGYVHFDFLGLKTLTVMDKAIKFIRENRGSENDLKFDIRKIKLDDPEVYKLLSSGCTRGVFQLESPGMKDLLMRLQPSSFEDIIAVLALYRPGPLHSGMVDEFIKRKHGQKDIDYLLPELREILKDTYGLFIYQEQIMKTANFVADYSYAEADILRRALGKKKPEEIEAQRSRFLEGARKKGICMKNAEEIFDTIEKFAEYSFNKSHATAYALITYQTAYIKTHYLDEFMAAIQSVDESKADATN